MLVNPWKKEGASQVPYIKAGLIFISDLSQGVVSQILVTHWKGLIFLLLHADEVYEKYANREDVRILVNYQHLLKKYFKEIN